MEKLLLAAVVVFILIGGLVSAIGSMLASPTAMIGLALASLPVVACMGLLLFVAAVFALRYAAMSWLAVRRQHVFVMPDENGLLPVAEQMLVQPTFAAATLGVHQTKATAVPSHIHYAPKYNATGADEVMEHVAQAFQPESFWQLWQAHKLPDSGFLMGYNLETGEPVTADWGKLYSALIGGQSGSGKSTLIRSILAQSAIQGGRFVVLDKHFGAGEESLGESLQPLRRLMLCDVAASDQQMIDALAYVRNIGEQRLSGASADKTPVILVVDETTAILQRSTTAQALTDVLGQIAQETRKVGVYALCIGQNFHSKIMDTTVRDSFVSFLSCRARRNVAKTMTDNNDFGKVAQDLAIGQAVWMTPGGDVYRLAVPNCTEHDLDLVASHFGAKTDTYPAKWAITPEAAGAKASAVSSAKASAETAIATPFALDARAIRALEMTATGASQADIIAEVWGVTGKGNDYKKASAEYRATIQQAIKGVMNER